MDKAKGISSGLNPSATEARSTTRPATTMTSTTVTTTVQSAATTTQGAIPREPPAKEIYLRDLPPELNLGSRVPLIPLGALSHRLSPCDACGAFSPKRLLSSCGHVFCMGCCMYQESSDGTDIRCFSCREMCCGSATKMSDRVLRSLRFACRCSFEGNLAELKEHLWKSETDHDFADGPKQGGGPGTITNCAGGPSKSYFWMSVQDLVTKVQGSEKPQRGTPQEWKTSGYTFDIVAQVQTGSDKEAYLGVALRVPPNKPTFAPWPIKRKIVVDVFNLEGKSIGKKDVCTYRDGKFVSELFQAPSLSTAYTVENIVKMKDITANNGLSHDGLVCVSMELRTM